MGTNIMCRPKDNPTTISYRHFPNIEEPKISRKRNRTLVHFAVNEATLFPSSSLSDDARSSTWYDHEELESFRREARVSAISSPVVQLLVKESRINSRNMQIDEKEIISERRRRKHVAIQAVLEAQRRLQCLPFNKDEKLANVSSQFSHLTRDIARRVAVIASVAIESNMSNECHSHKRQCLSAY